MAFHVDLPTVPVPGRGITLDRPPTFVCRCRLVSRDHRSSRRRRREHCRVTKKTRYLCRRRRGCCCRCGQASNEQQSSLQCSVPVYSSRSQSGLTSGFSNRYRSDWTALSWIYRHLTEAPVLSQASCATSVLTEF